MTDNDVIRQFVLFIFLSQFLIPDLIFNLANELYLARILIIILKDLRLIISIVIFW